LIVKVIDARTIVPRTMAYKPVGKVFALARSSGGGMS